MPFNVTVPTELPKLYTTVEVVCAVVSFFGNSLVLIAFVRFRRVRSVTNYYVISLAVADLLVAIVGIPSALATSVGHFAYPQRDYQAELAWVAGEIPTWYTRERLDLGHVSRPTTSISSLSRDELGPNVALHRVHSVSGSRDGGSVLGDSSTTEVQG